MAEVPPAAPVAPPVPLREPVQALIIDIDGTIKPSFDQTADRVRNAIQRYAASRAAARGQSVDAITQQIWHDIAKTDPRQWMHNNIAYLGEQLDSLKARPGESFAADDAAIAHAFVRERDQNLRLFEGVAEVLTKARAAGAAVIVHTDAPPSRVAYEFYRLGVDLSQIDEIHTRQEPPFTPPPHGVDSAEAAYTTALMAKVTQQARIKPNGDVVDDIVARYGLERDRTLFVGDHACDGLTAGAAGVAFAWQRQGAEVKPETAALQKRLVGDRYRLGPEPQAQTLQAAGCWPPSLTLDRGFGQLAQLRYAAAPALAAAATRPVPPPRPAAGAAAGALGLG